MTESADEEKVNEQLRCVELSLAHLWINPWHTTNIWTEDYGTIFYTVDDAEVEFKVYRVRATDPAEKSTSLPMPRRQSYTSPSPVLWPGQVKETEKTV